MSLIQKCIFASSAKDVSKNAKYIISNEKLSFFNVKYSIKHYVHF